MQLISTVHEFALCLNQRGQSDVLQLLLRFCKEFDKVPHYQVTLLLRIYTRLPLQANFGGKEKER